MAEPQEVARLYGARWEIEILFKKLKSKYALDVVPTINPLVIEAFYLDRFTHTSYKQKKSKGKYGAVYPTQVE